MTRLRRLWFLVRSLAVRVGEDADTDRELRFHLEMETAANLEAGMAPDQARRTALRDFGGVEAVKQECREATGAWFVESFFQDLRLGARRLRREPVFALVSVLTLALAIGATTAIFTVVDGVLLRPLPLPEPDRLVIVWETDRVQGTDREGASLPDFFDLRSQSRLFARLAAYDAIDLTLQHGAAEPERIVAARVSSSYLPLLGVEPSAGRGFTAEEEEPGRGHVAVLGHGLWRRRFGGDPAVVGASLLLSGESYTVVGVMPPEALLPGNVEELWVPLAPVEADLVRGRHIFGVYGRLARGVTLEAAQAEIDTIMGRLEQEYYEDNVGRGARVVPLHGDLVRGVKQALTVLLAAVGTVLLIACVNVASLLLARAAARSRDAALASALGAGRLRLVRELLTESLLMAAAGGGLGLAFAWWGTRLLVALAPGGIPRLGEVGLDGRVLAFTAFVSLATWGLFGVLPALKASRADLRGALDGGGGGPGRERQRLRRALVVAEVAMSVVLLVGTGLLLRSFWRLRQVEPGYDPESLLAATVELPESRYPIRSGWPILSWPEVDRVSGDLLERLRALPRIGSAALAFYNPVDGGWTTRVWVEGRPEPPLDQVEEAHYRAVSEGYLETLRVPLLAGRTFTSDDRAGAPQVVVVNRALVSRYFPDEEPLGRALRVYGVPREIVGVVGDVRYLGLDVDPRPTMYLPTAQNPLARITVVARVEGPTSAVVPDLRALVAAVDRDLALFDVLSVEEALTGSLADRRFTLLLLATFAATALAMAAVGIYGVLSYLVSQRTREIGIRMALGAVRRQVLVPVLGSALALTLAGAGLGALAAVGLSSRFAGMLFQVRGTDVATLGSVAGVLVLVALLAGWWPAHRAARIEPQAVLRQD